MRRKSSTPGRSVTVLGRVFRHLSPFWPRRNLLSTAEYRREMDTPFSTWNEVVGLSTA
jgi:hypothetical protein